MARSHFIEDQMGDEDVLSEYEHSIAGHYFSDLVDTPPTYSGSEGKYLRSTSSGIEFCNVVSDATIDYVEVVSGTLQNEIDSLTYLDLYDSPITYSGEAGKAVVVNDEENGLNFDFYEWDVEGPLIPETAISGTRFVNFEGGRLLIGATGGRPDLVYNGPIAGLAFDSAKLEACYGIFKVPYAWNTESDIKLTINYMVDSDQTGIKTCAWRLDYHTYAHGELYGNKTTSVVTINTNLSNDTVAGTYLTEELLMPCNCENNPIARGDMIPFKFYRDGVSGSDNMEGDSILMSLIYELQVGQGGIGD